MIAQSAKFIKRLLQGDALPAYVIFREPAVVISYFEDFLKHRDAILKALDGSKPHLLFQFGWHRETQERADEVAREAAEVSRLRPEAEMIFLCNSERELALIAGVGLRRESLGAGMGAMVVTRTPPDERWRTRCCRPSACECAVPAVRPYWG